MQSNSPLHSAFSSLADARTRLLGAALRWRIAWLWSASLLIVLLVDANTPMVAWVRLLLAVAFILVPVCCLFYSRGHGRGQALRDARDLEVHYELANNPLVNGLALSSRPAEDGQVLEQTLRDRSHGRACAVIENVDRDVVLDQALLRRQRIYMLLVAMVWALVLWLVPGVVSIGSLRLWLPFGDQPSFSFTTIRLQANDSKFTAGDDVSFQANVTGDPTEAMDLVEVDSAGRELRRWPMRGQGEATFTRDLQSLTEPMWVQAEANGTRSKRLRLEPQRIETEQAIAQNNGGVSSESSTSNKVSKNASPQKANAPGSGQGEGDQGAVSNESASDSLLSQTPQAGGAFTQQVEAATDAPMQLEATMQYVPATYRGLVRRYYQRLADDEKEQQ